MLNRALQCTLRLDGVSSEPVLVRAHHTIAVILRAWAAIAGLVSIPQTTSPRPWEPGPISLRQEDAVSFHPMRALVCSTSTGDVVASW